VALTEVQARHATAAAQGIMSALGTQVAPDGIWSTKTQAVYDKLSGSQASQVDAVMSAAAGKNVSGKDVQAYRESQRLAGYNSLQGLSGHVGTKDEVRRLITAIALEEGVPPAAAIKFATVESGLNPNAKSATGASGLFQLTKPAIDQIGIQPPNGNRLDPEWNIRVGVKYMKWVARFLKTTFDDVGLIYAGYNLGVGNVRALQKGDYSNEKAKLALSQQAAALQKGGTPQYLANAKAFVDRATV